MGVEGGGQLLQVVIPQRQKLDGADVLACAVDVSSVHEPVDHPPRPVVNHGRRQHENVIVSSGKENEFELEVVRQPELVVDNMTELLRADRRVPVERLNDVDS